MLLLLCSMGGAIWNAGDDLQSILDVLLPGLQEPAVDSKAPCRVPVVQEPETKGKAPKSPLTEEGILQKDVAASVAAMDKLFGPPQAPLATAGDTLPPLHRTVGKQVTNANDFMAYTASLMEDMTLMNHIPLMGSWILCTGVRCEWDHGCYLLRHRREAAAAAGICTGCT